MADIRQNPIALDQFDYGDVLDYLTNYNSDWVDHPAGGLAGGLTYRPVGSGEGHATARYPTDRRAFCYWSPLVLDGDDQEVWARERGGTGSGKSWRLSLTKNPVYAGISGYSFTITVGTGGGSWFIRRYDGNATGTIIASGVSGAPTAEPRYCLLRRSGSYLQAFRAGSAGTDTSNWAQIYNVFDETYMTGLYPTLWIADDAHQNHGYDEFGAGPAPLDRRTRIIRWVSN